MSKNTQNYALKHAKMRTTIVILHKGIKKIPSKTLCPFVKLAQKRIKDSRF
jgi:hypothetical protein